MSTEAQTWNENGGRCTFIRYGNTFRYPQKSSDPDRIRIFTGGTSDRDQASLKKLVDEVLRDNREIELLIADGSGPKIVQNETGSARARWLPVVTAEDFGNALSTADITFLPLDVTTNRSSGQMVAIGSLECGIPIATNRSPGLLDYTGKFIRVIDTDTAILPQLEAILADPAVTPQRIRQEWRERYSLDAYARRVGDALQKGLQAPPAPHRKRLSAWLRQTVASMIFESQRSEE